MSNEIKPTDAVSDFDAKIVEDARLDRIKRETANSKVLLEEARIKGEMLVYEQNQKDLENAKKTKFGVLNDDQILKLQMDNADYIAAAKNSMQFLVPAFDSIVPFFRKNLILICGKTGEGKSTAVANLIWSTIQMLNPLTGKRRRVLAITNEEKAEDVYNRVTALARGWHYVNHDKITPEQATAYSNGIAGFARSGMLTVIDNQYNGTSHHTTSVEGIRNIFDRLIEDKEYYDVILIDYYQNVTESKTNSRLSQYQVQEELSALLDDYKNYYPAPIVLFAQVRPPDEQNTPLEIRIKGAKMIITKATHVMEIIADRANFKTLWEIHKSRFTEAVGQRAIETGYDRGKFVPYTDEFKAKIAPMIEKKLKSQLDKAINFKLPGEEGSEYEDEK